MIFRHAPDQGLKSLRPGRDRGPGPPAAHRDHHPRRRLPRSHRAAGRPRTRPDPVRPERRGLPRRQPGGRHRRGAEPDRQAAGGGESPRLDLPHPDHHQWSPATGRRPEIHRDAGQRRQHQPDRPGHQGPRRLHHRPESARSRQRSPAARRAGEENNPVGLHRDRRDGVRDVPSRPVQHALDRVPDQDATQVGVGSVSSPPPALIPTPKGGSPKVLILFSDTGGGHRAAARALTDALKQLDPTCVVTLPDPLMSQGPTVVRRLASLYSPMIQRSRTAWGAVYHSSNTKPTFAALRAVFGRGVRNAIVELLLQQDPDVVLSVHPLLNQVAYQAIQKSGRQRGLMTVITDLVDFHRGWTFSKADLVVAPTELARKVALRRRVPAERVKLLGLPVDLRFRPPAPGEKRALRRRYGLDETRFTVLVIGGAAGAGNLLKQGRALAWEPYQWQLVVVAGRNEKLRRRLARVRFATPTLILGFVDYMPELMRASDVVVTKAGPGAIAEALATGVPVSITGFLPGQESPNVDYVVESGFGMFAPKEAELFDEIRVLAEGGPTWQEMSRRAVELAHPYASADIARECLLLAARYRASA